MVADNIIPFDPKKSPSVNRDTVPHSEDAIAYEFAHVKQHELRFDHSRSQWFLWCGTHWKIDETGGAFESIRLHCSSMTAGTSKSEGKRIASAKHAKAIETFAKSDPRLAISAKWWDADPFLLATPAGTVNLKTGIMREPRPDDMISRIASVGPSDKDCPQWHKFLDEACAGNEDQITFLQKMAGYALTGDTREHALFFIYGNGGNGKGVFLNTLTRIMKDYAVTAPMESFTSSRFGDKPTADLAMLAGARLVTASETEEGNRWAESRIKSLTGGDPISARFMRENFFTFRPIFKLLIIGNHMPSLKSVDAAARRRFRLVPFENTPKEVDKELEEKLKPEWPAILRWMIDGCLMWQGTGLEPPENVKSATEHYFSEQDILQQWLEERCDIDINAKVDSTLAFIDWQQFATKAGEFVGTKTRLTQSLEKKGFICKPARVPSSDKPVRAYHKFKLKFTHTEHDT